MKLIMLHPSNSYSEEAITSELLFDEHNAGNVIHDILGGLSCLVSYPDLPAGVAVWLTPNRVLVFSGISNTGELLGLTDEQSNAVRSSIHNTDGWFADSALYGRMFQPLVYPQEDGNKTGLISDMKNHQESEHHPEQSFTCFDTDDISVFDYECDMDADPFYSQNPNAMSVNTATRDYGAELDEIRKAIDEIYKELALADCYYEQKIKEETERLSQWIEGPRYP